MLRHLLIALSAICIATPVVADPVHLRAGTIFRDEVGRPIANGFILFRDPENAGRSVAFTRLDDFGRAMSPMNVPTGAEMWFSRDGNRFHFHRKANLTD